MSIKDIFDAVVNYKILPFWSLGTIIVVVICLFPNRSSQRKDQPKK